MADNIDGIKRLSEMIEVLELLNVEYDQDNDRLEDMKRKAKEKIKEQSSGSGKYSKGTTGFSVLSKSKDDDISKRSRLRKFFSEIKDCVGKMDEKLLSIINKDIPNIASVVNERTESLDRKDYNLLVAGESSSGKSSLLNLILGEELLPHFVLNTTSTICELKYGEEKQIVLHHMQNENGKGENTPPTTHTLKSTEECGKTHQEQISPFVHLKNREEGSKLKKVEIFWPNELLQEGVVIVDTPGIGESDVMDEILMNYLPKAFAFMYVIDVSRAGGFQQDFKYKLLQIFNKLRALEVGGDESDRLAECSLFVCNKWDLVNDEERGSVQAYHREKLREYWPNANLNSQMVYMSTTDAIKAQYYGGITPQFNLLLESISLIIRKAINIRLYNHWAWLDAALHSIQSRTLTFSHGIALDDHTKRERMNSIESRIKTIEEDQDAVKQKIQESLEEKTKFLYKKVSEFLQSDEFQTKFCRWGSSSFPPEGETWNETKSNIIKAIEYRFNKFLVEWEEVHGIYSEIHKQLVDEYLLSLNLIEDELVKVEKAMHGDGSDCPSNSNSPLALKLLVGATAPIWVPLSVACLIFGVPIYGTMVLTKRVSQHIKTGNYQHNPREYLERKSKKFLNSITDEVVHEYVKKQMEETKMVISKYIDSIPGVIEVNREVVNQLRNESRTQNEILQLYGPIEKKAREQRENLSSLGVELYPPAVDSCDVDWKQDTASCVGEGEFALVYRGSLKMGESKTAAAEAITPTNVVVKVFKQAFDNLNSRFYLEETMIRHLNHKNVLTFYGAMQLPSDSRNLKKIAFVMKSCETNLRKVIFEDVSVTPAKAENSRLAIEKFLNWAKGIAHGLCYIHHQRFVHRHLKLENILVDKDGTAMISDIGVVGRYLETEKSIMYLAPEVLQNLQNRTKAADIYSFGIMLWEMWYGTQAFKELMPLKKAVFQENITNGHRPLQDGTLIGLPQVNNIMEFCWRTNPNERPQAKECSTSLENIFENYTKMDKERAGDSKL